MPYNCKNSFSRWGLQLFDFPLLIFSIAMFIEIFFYPTLISSDPNIVEIDTLLSTAPISSIDVKSPDKISIKRSSHSYFYYKEKSVELHQTCGKNDPTFNKDCGSLDMNSKMCISQEEECPIQEISFQMKVIFLVIFLIR